MIIERGKGNGGIYFYFFCRGRKSGKCDLPYLGMAKVEAAVEQHFATLRLSADFITKLRTQFSDAMKFEQRSLSGFKKRLNSRLAELDTQEDHFLDLVGDPDWPKAKIQKKLTDIEAERAEIAAQLTDTGVKLDTGRQFFLHALELLSDPQGFYRRGSAGVKKAMTKLAFGKINLDAHDLQGQELAAFVASHELTEGIDALVEVGSPEGSKFTVTTTLTPDSKRDPHPGG